MKRSRRLEQRQRPQALLDHIRQFLSPQVWKQTRQTTPRHATPRRRKPERWDLQPLVLILLARTWAAGDSQPERFGMARGFSRASDPARRRPGKTIQGFQKALARLPMRPLRAPGRRRAPRDPPPLSCRLMRVPARGPAKPDVW